MVTEVLGDGETWGRAELKMIDFAEPPTVLERLQIWSFKNNWQDTLDRANDFIGGITRIYEIINSSEMFLQMLGYILGVGNVLNGGSNKG